MIYSNNKNKIKIKTKNMKKTKRFFNLFMNLSLTAILVINQAVFLLAPMNFAGAQDATTTDTSTIIFPNTTTDAADTATNYILSLNFQSPPAKVSGSAVFYVETSEEADVVFYVLKDGTALNKYPSVYQGNKIYYFKLDAAALNNGEYAIKAYAQKSGYIDISKQISVMVENIITNYQTDTTVSTNIETNIDYYIQPLENKLSPVIYNNTTTTAANTAIVNTVLDVQPKPIEQPILRENIYLVQIFPECREKGINTEEECKKFMSIPPECRYKGILTLDECGKFMSIPPECREKGLSQEKCNEYMSIPPECREKGILDKEECKKFMYKYAMPYDCRKAGVATQEGCSKIIFNNSLAPECRQAGAATFEECEKILRGRVSLTPECDKANITNPEKCDKYMAENFMPQECKEAGAASKEKCDYILRNKYSNLDNAIKTEFKPVVDFGYVKNEGLPAECREAGVKTSEECNKIMFIKNSPAECREANISDPEKCKKHMETINLPQECRDAKVTTKEECEKVMFKKYAPKECAEANINNAKECEKLMFKKYAPKDCLAAGITTEEACKKHMFEKYGGQENIPVDKLPIECQKAGAKTPEECEKAMKKIYMPQECQGQGITNEDSCQKYLELKNMPQECRSAGAKTRSECDKAMFKKYAPKECLEAGVNDEKECNNFMFNKYAPQVRCKDVDDWQCKNSIKENHLGNIVSKQAQFKELKENIIQKVGASATVEELKASLESAKEIIPFKDQKINLKVVAVKEDLILDDGDNLIQTGPVAVMVDSDGDGLPDDMEKRFGTDPQKTDSDDDGYSDSDEVKNKYSPLGSGQIEEIMSPIDEAIVSNKTLGQPKTEGDESEDLVVKAAANKNDEQGQASEGYVFTGQAEPNSVVTVYIYSDLPLVATAKVDEYGNWQYELGNSLNEGEHEVYVAVNDNTGKVLSKSKPLNFFVKEAKAVSVKDFVAPAAAQTVKKSESSIKYYVIIAILTMVVGILLFVIFHFQRKKYLFKA